MRKFHALRRINIGHIIFQPLLIYFSKDKNKQYTWINAENGTHYCDITGETDWVRKMIDKYDEVARKSGEGV